MEEDVMRRLPFAVIDDMTDGSPAAVDGLQLWDEIVKFGNVEAGDRWQESFVSEALSNGDCQVHLGIIRQGSPMNLTITPRKWLGRGLLGKDYIYWTLEWKFNSTDVLLTDHKHVRPSRM
ncbi:hypothetical protein GUJ93_ZPchr0009g590 [Zizania palustris]|uniref:PDZ domain-containing protein n=1 Tax=Zizania palustris TaxID=103762 RepID=A0A8J5S522_ZIZPA|nr:hypothetical protein GUJ93_ZPchr0009g590 [Zizania palustris]